MVGVSGVGAVVRPSDTREQQGRMEEVREAVAIQVSVTIKSQASEPGGNWKERRSLVGYATAPARHSASDLGPDAPASLVSAPNTRQPW